MTGTTSLHITITDVNNKRPMFTPAQQSVKLLENTTTGQPFFTYTAVDPDENALLRYKLVDEQVKGEDENGQNYPNKEYLNSLFGIHSNNGTVYVKGVLNREVAEEITVVVFVEDLNAEQPRLQNATGN